MAKKRKAAGRDAPGASRPPAARLKATATAANDDEVSPETSLIGGGARGRDAAAERRTRTVAVAPPPQPQEMPEEEYSDGIFQRLEERGLRIGNIWERDFDLGFMHGRMASLGWEEEVASSWRRVPPSSTQTSPSGKGKELAAVAQAAQPPAHADQPAAASQSLPSADQSEVGQPQRQRAARAAAAQVQPPPHADQPAPAAAAPQASQSQSPPSADQSPGGQRPAGQPPAAFPLTEDDYVWCKSCGVNLAPVLRVPVRHVCRCLRCRCRITISGSSSPDPRPCSFCNGTLR